MGSKSFPRIILWLVLLSLGLLFVPLYLIATTLKQENSRLQDENSIIQQTLAYTPLPDATSQALTDTLLQIQANQVVLEAMQPTLIAEHINWSQVMFALGSYDPNQLSITAMSQAENQLTLQGKAVDQSQVMAYVDSLKQSDLFSDVMLQSLVSAATPQPEQPGSSVDFIIVVEFA